MFFQKRQIPAVFDPFCAGIPLLDHRRVFQRQYRRTGRLSPLIWFSEPRRSGPVSRRASLLKFMVGGHVLKQDIICFRLVRPACATTKWRKITTLLFRVRWLLWRFYIFVRRMWLKSENKFSDQTVLRLSRHGVVNFERRTSRLSKSPQNCKFVRKAWS